jgi:hypothetical protein
VCLELSQCISYETKPHNTRTDLNTLKLTGRSHNYKLSNQKFKAKTAQFHVVKSSKLISDQISSAAPT